MSIFTDLEAKNRQKHNTSSSATATSKILNRHEQEKFFLKYFAKFLYCPRLLNLLLNYQTMAVIA